MSKKQKLREKLLDGNADKNFDLQELCTLAQHLGFTLRGGKGGHSVFHKEGIPEIINLQPTKDGKAKPYQVRQIRDIMLKHRL
jgi:hypothetical protein